MLMYQISSAVSHRGREEGEEFARGREGGGEAREGAGGAAAVGLGLPELGCRGGGEQTGATETEHIL